MVKNFFRDTLFGNSRSWKRSQGQIPKNYFKKIFDGELGILGKFPLRIWFLIHMGFVDFELQAFLPLTKNEITFGPISILFCTKSLLKAQK